MTPNQFKVTRKAGCVRDGRVVAPEEIPETVRETLRRVAAGDENVEIAVDRHLSYSAVQKHVTALMVVYGVRNRVQLVASAIRQGHV